MEVLSSICKHHTHFAVVLINFVSLLGCYFLYFLASFFLLLFFELLSHFLQIPNHKEHHCILNVKKLLPMHVFYEIVLETGIARDCLDLLDYAVPLLFV